MSEQQDILPVERRHFWSRAFAFLLDVLLIGTIAGFLMVPVSVALDVDVGASSFVRMTTCRPAPADWPTVRQLEAEWPVAAGETRNTMICTISLIGAAGYDLLHSVTQSVSQSGAMTLTSSRSVSTRVDKDGNAIFGEEKPDFSIPLMVAIFAFFTANGRRSPGKVILGLRATTAAGGQLGWSTALLREALKLIPLLSVFLSQIYLWIVPPFSTLSEQIVMVRQASFLIAPVVGGVLGLVWWLGPFIVWRGATWYDWLAGTIVTRTGKG